MPTPDTAVLPMRSEPSAKNTVALPLMRIAPPDASAVFCMHVQRTNKALPPDAKTAPPRLAIFPTKIVRRAVTVPARIRRAPPKVASHASNRQSSSTSDVPVISSGALCRERWRNSICGAPARSSKRRASRAEARRTVPGNPTSRTSLARMVSSKMNSAVGACSPAASFSSAGRPRDASTRSRLRAAVMSVALAGAPVGFARTAMG